MDGARNREKQAVLEQIWLGYFNQTLFEKGLITERERNVLKLKIESRETKKVPMHPK